MLLFAISSLPSIASLERSIVRLPIAVLRSTEAFALLWRFAQIEAKSSQTTESIWIKRAMGAGIVRSDGRKDARYKCRPMTRSAVTQGLPFNVPSALRARIDRAVVCCVYVGLDLPTCVRDQR